jgi:hypothetical protein
MKKLIMAAAVAFASIAATSAMAASNCYGPDCLGSLGLDISTQDICTQVTSQPTHDMRWVEGLSRQVDQEVLGCRIAAYRLQWFNGAWSGEWYVPGVNDLDLKYNINDGTVRRMWAYFSDHRHTYIQCCAPKSEDADSPLIDSPLPTKPTKPNPLTKW